MTGGLGYDEFFDSSPANSGEIDTLLETFDLDVGLFNDKLVAGSLLNSQGTGAFEVGKNAANELTDAGDRWAAGAIVENLKNQFEVARINGGSGNNTLVVNDLNSQIRVGNGTLSVINWRGHAILDNAANDGLWPEYYLVTVPFDNPAIVDVRDSANDTNDTRWRRRSPSVA